jgi:NAD+ diphosphatase
MALTTFFSGGTIARSAVARDDQAALEQAWHAPDTRFVVMHESRCLVRDGHAQFLSSAELGSGVSAKDGAYLGHVDGGHVFALPLPQDAGIDAAAFENFRGLLGDLPAADAALLAYAKGTLEWQLRHRYCGLCGARNEPTGGGFVLVCSNCEHKCFPRVDPAIIVLVVDGDGDGDGDGDDDEERCLLGRQKFWPDGRYSTIAGFVEPGESLEDAVAREVQEETNVEITEARYLGSQPWPFPTAMMVGFHARAASTDIVLNDGELADARWLTRKEITAGEIVLPPTTSIAFRLIEKWFDAGDGPALESFGLSGSFSRSTGERT